jgi:O-antigen/teichoic acid export membrane protein
MSDETPTSGDETEKERVDRELIEFLNELRVVLPGVQVLFAFLLTLPFTGTFDTITGYELFAYSIAFYFTAMAAVLLITPTSFHRLRFRKGDKEAILRVSNRLILGGIACLGVAIVAVVWLVSELVFTDRIANMIALAAVAIVLLLWLVLPLQRRFRHG